MIRKLSVLALLLILFVGFAGATMPDPTFNTGPESGVMVKALKVLGDAQVVGNLYTNGTSVVDGVISDDVAFASGKDIRFSGGNSLFDMSGASGVFKTPTGIATFAGHNLIAGGKNITALTGAGIFDWSLSTGAFKTSTGVNTMGGHVNIAGGKNITALTGAGVFDWSLSSGAFKTGTGAATLNGDTTVVTSKTLAVTTVDKLTVGGVIVPQAITIPVQFDSSTTNGTVFIPISGNYQVIGISEVNSVACNTAAATTFTIVKLTGTQAPATQGVAVGTAVSAKGTAETIATSTISTTLGRAQVNTTERLGIQLNNPLTSLAGGCISISLKRIA